ncbi:tetratricopeptide repeat protein [Pseudidiomarina homiensis]|uniref:Tetratricopeptide repeat-like domain-containing protein n=1 Tax=Pseudidiomarina homiensis TaxID=364198 RepID=A0A432Y5R4_9GAMM|nr:tetratricopeptide repeat protein [Pseudidiomarina homiensis]RUO56231.1 hypothetical protein CWI70_05630 [Pseudidiomarina homiensis]
MAAHNTLMCVIAGALLLFGGSALAGERHLSEHGREDSTLLQQADALQYNHEFDAALKLLSRIVAQGQHVEQARLMEARIFLAQGRIDAARESCAALMGKASLTITGTCLLEVRGRAAFSENDQQTLEQTYTQLQQLAVPLRAERSAQMSPAIFVWQRQLLAEQAFLLGRFAESIQWLSYASYSVHPTVNQIRLLDSWLAMQQPQKIFEVHEDCPQVGELPADSIIVRLAAAELARGTEECWQKLAAERMEIRIARADPLHTSDLAFYFVHVVPNAAQAQQYASQNYAVAREPADQRLLLAAQALPTQPETANED